MYAYIILYLGSNTAGKKRVRERSFLVVGEGSMWISIVHFVGVVVVVSVICSNVVMRYSMSMSMY